MGVSCEHSCGVCALGEDGGVKRLPHTTILNPPLKAKAGGSKKKKTKKKTAAMAGGAAAAGTAKPAAAKAAEPAAAKAAEPAAAKAAEPAAKVTKEGAGGTKKKGWMSGLKEAVGGAFKGKKEKAPPKDET